MKATTLNLSFVALGAAGIATLALAQTQGQDPGTRTTTSQQGTTSEGLRELVEAQKRFQDQVLQEIRQNATQHDLRIEENDLAVSICGQKGMIAGAPASSMSGRSTGDTGDLPGRDEDEPTTGRTGSADKGEAKGIVLVTGLFTASSTGDTTRSTMGKSVPPGSYQVHCDKTTNEVELVDDKGQVAATFPLVKITKQGASTLEAGATRPGERDERTGSYAKENDWPTIYASVLFGLNGDK